MSEVHAPSRFNLMDMLIAFTAIAAIIVAIYAAQNRSRAVSYDVRRNSVIQQLQKALAFSVDKNGVFPTYKGCILGDDLMTKTLEEDGFLQKSAGLVDPRHPADPEKCLYYEGGGTDYLLRYTLETSSGAGEPGTYTVKP